MALPCHHLGGVPFVEEIVSHEIAEEASADSLCEALEAAVVELGGSKVSATGVPHLIGLREVQACHPKVVVIDAGFSKRDGKLMGDVDFHTVHDHVGAISPVPGGVGPMTVQYEDVAFLSWAKPTSGTPKHIEEGALAAIREGKTSGYTETAGLPALRAAIADKLQRDNNIPAEADEILVTVGAVEGLTAAVLATVNPGDEVILPSPTYSTHVNQVRLAGGIPVFAPTIEEDGFALDVEKIRSLVTPKTKAFLFCTPSNPTGTVFSKENLEAIAEIALKHNLMIITDEAYEYFVYDEVEHFSIGAIPEVRKQVISCFTFTKTYAMTGWRVGYLHADKSVVPMVRKAHIPLAICAPVVSQYAALAALKGPQDCIKDFGDKYLSARNVMCARLEKLSKHMSFQTPKGSYLMCPRILSGVDSREFCKDVLDKVKVSMTPGVAFGPTGESHVRLSFCVPEKMIHDAFDRLETYFGA